MQTARKPDALLVPRSFMSGVKEGARLEAFRVEFIPTLGSRQAHAALSGDARAEYLVTPDGTSARFYGPGHTREGDERYDWFVAEKGQDGVYRPASPLPDHPGVVDTVRVGYLKADPDAETPEAKAALAEGLKAAMAQHQADPRYRQHLIDLGVIRESDWPTAPLPMPGNEPNQGHEGVKP